MILCITAEWYTLATLVAVHSLLGTAFFQQKEDLKRFYLIKVALIYNGSNFWLYFWQIRPSCVWADKCGAQIEWWLWSYTRKVWLDIIFASNNVVIYFPHCFCCPRKKSGRCFMGVYMVVYIRRNRRVRDWLQSRKKFHWECCNLRCKTEMENFAAFFCDNVNCVISQETWLVSAFISVLARQTLLLKVYFFASSNYMEGFVWTCEKDSFFVCNKCTCDTCATRSSVGIPCLYLT